MAHTWNPSVRMKLKKEDCHEFKASLCHISRAQLKKEEEKEKRKKPTSNVEGFDLGQF